MPKKVIKYVEKIVEVPQMIMEEKLVEIAEPIRVEATTQVPRSKRETVPKEIPKFSIKVQEMKQEVWKGA